MDAHQSSAYFNGGSLSLSDGYLHVQPTVSSATGNTQLSPGQFPLMSVYMHTRVLWVASASPSDLYSVN